MNENLNQESRCPGLVSSKELLNRSVEGYPDNNLPGQLDAIVLDVQYSNMLGKIRTRDHNVRAVPEQNVTRTARMLRAGLLSVICSQGLTQNCKSIRPATVAAAVSDRRPNNILQVACQESFRLSDYI
jgi:hypothetical protein